MKELSGCKQTLRMRISNGLFTCGFVVVFVDFTEDQLVLAPSEWVAEDGHGVEVHV